MRLPKRFWDKVCKAHGCWVWIAAKNQAGYGHMWWKLGLVKAHRLSYMEAYGTIPKGKRVLHQCDNPSCVNPKHLFLGTMKDNSQDCIRKGRWSKHQRPQGSKHGYAKLTEAQIKEIRRLYALEAHAMGGNGHIKQRVKYSGSRLGKMFGVNNTTIYRIVNGKGWVHA